jgi:hypothetical protein
LDWDDLKANLAQEGPFSAESILVCGHELYLFVWSRGGVHAFQLDKFDRIWRHVSEIHTTFGFVTSAIEPNCLILISENPESAVRFKSTDRGRSWNEFRVGFKGTPIHLQLSGSGKGLCCVWHSRSEEDYFLDEGSSLHSTSDFGETWKLVAKLEKMTLAAISFDRGERVLLGGADGLLAVCDSESCYRIALGSQDDIVAIDSRFGFSIVVLESEDDPANHRLFVGENADSWHDCSLQLNGRVVGVKLISGSNAIVCTSRELYLCRLGTLK